MGKKTLLVSVVLALACAVAADAREVHKTVALDATGQLTVDSHNGSITVTAWNKPSVDIVARIVPDFDATEEDVDATEIRVIGSGSSVRVETNYDRVPFRFWFGRHSPPVHYTISMPATAKLSIASHNSSIKVRGLRGDVTVDDHNGDIDVDDHDGGVEIESHNGGVSVEFSRFSKPARIETHNGSIEVRMPSRAAFQLDADGHRLSFDSDFPVATRDYDRDEVRGTVNGGGPRLKLSTHQGSIRVKKI